MAPQDPQNHVLALERAFWTEGPEFYQSHADRQCLVAFPGMSTVLSPTELAATVKGSRWENPRLEVKGFIQPTPDTAVLTYEAQATKAGSSKYSAVVSSLYVRRGEEWKLAFHQQAPVPTSDAPDESS